MAASLPALSSLSAGADTAVASVAAVSTTVSSPGTTNASKNLRGLNKPKCIMCGNVARSRCPYQSCKSCCAKAQNPCHIHVLKGSSSLPDKIPSSGASGASGIDHLSTEATLTGSHRAASVRQLSTNFSQFNNLQTPPRSRKPLTRKDAHLINEWRFLKLKEFKDSNVLAENEAFDRYMQNVGLLDEVFAVNSSQEGQIEDDGSTTDDSENVIAGLKIQLRSDPTRIANTRKRMQYIVDQGIKKLRKLDTEDSTANVNDPETLGKKQKVKSSEADQDSVFTDLVDQLNKARNEEDLKACWEMKSQFFDKHDRENQVESDGAETIPEQSPKTSLPPVEPSRNSLMKSFSTATVDQESLSRLNAHFDSLEDIEEL